MTGRFSRRIAEVHDIAQSIIDNHPLTEIVDSSTPCKEVLDSDIDIRSSRTESTQSWTSKRENYASSKISTNRSSTIFSEGNSTGGTSWTLSTDSWCDDEFEKENTKKVRNILDNIDQMIYENTMQEELSPEVQDECHLWASKFPSLRILGKKVLHSDDDNFQFHLPLIKLPDTSKTNEATSSFVNDSHFSTLPLTGKELKSSNSSCILNIDTCSNEGQQDNAKGTNFVEETIAQHGQYEEIISCHNFVNCEKFNEENSISQKTPLIELDIELVRERVLDKVMERLWPEILSLWRSIKDEQNNDEKGLCHKKILPSLSLPPKSSDIKRTQEPCNFQQSLDGILMVSSKVLQKRDHRFSADLSIVTRPGSSLTSPHRAVSLHSNTSRQEASTPHNALQYANSNLPSVPNSRASSATRRFGRYVNRDIEWFEALQEEGDGISNINRSHAHLQQHFSEEDDENLITRISTSHFSLPPIIDANTILSTKQSIKSPISPLSLENSLLDRISNNQAFKNEKIDSRPSTCKSTRSTLGQRSKNLKNLEFPLARNPPDVPVLGGLASKILSPSIQKEIGPQFPTLGPKFTPDKLVTLFPIIKSLELQKQDDNKKATRINQSAKKAGRYNALNQLKR